MVTLHDSARGLQTHGQAPRADIACGLGLEYPMEEPLDLLLLPLNEGCHWLRRVEPFMAQVCCKREGGQSVNSVNAASLLRQYNAAAMLSWLAEGTMATCNSGSVLGLRE